MNVLQEEINKKTSMYYSEIKDKLPKMEKECPDGELTWFIAQCGDNYPKEYNTGIVFYGRANNGWDPEVEHSMDELSQQSFRPFFYLIKSITEKYYAQEWYSHIAWSNVCKIIPWNGGKNPSNALWYTQYKYMCDIIRAELKVLQPHIVIVITGNTAGARWDGPFFKDCEEEKYKICSKVWLAAEKNQKNHKDCTATLYKMDGRLYIITDRPESRPIEPHVECIFNLIEMYK